MQEQVQTALRITVYANDGIISAGKQISLASDSTFLDFLGAASDVLGIDSGKYVFTEHGAEVEAIDEILPDDHLYISDGGPFVRAEAPKIDQDNDLISSEQTKPGMSITEKRKQLYRKHEADILQIQSVFPKYHISELLSAFLMNDCSQHRTIEMLLTAPQKIAELNTAHKDLNTRTMTIEIVWDGASRSEARKFQFDPDAYISDLDGFLFAAAVVLDGKEVKSIYSKDGERITDVALINNGDLVFASSMDDSDDEDESIAQQDVSKEEKILNGLAEILPHLPRTKLQAALEKAKWDSDVAMLSLLEES
eukprot:TRINITY_DN1202_c0_g3_i1.p1 TRINITY_DN1202_c0_g3~~TRINITY_DN1202_c0_g3_i1.p1  ORF type:complete len:309 (+),score=61.07 TRINITY_DN1202_c0_g3_i1:116-1042(+)